VEYSTGFTNPEIVGDSVKKAWLKYSLTIEDQKTWYIFFKEINHVAYIKLLECLEKQTSWSFFKFVQIFDPSFISTIQDISIYSWQEISQYFPFASTSPGLEKEFANYLNWVCEFVNFLNSF